MLYYDGFGEFDISGRGGFGIGRLFANQQNIYRVTPVHYLQKAEKKTRERTIQYRRGEKRIHGNHICLLSATPVNHDQAVQLIFVFNGLLLLALLFVIVLYVCLDINNT